MFVDTTRNVPSQPPLKTDQAQFNTALYHAGAQPKVVPVKHAPSTPAKQDPAPQTPAKEGVTFGPDEPENGIETYPVQTGGPWPFQMYRHTPFGFDTNDELHSELAATPGLDPKAFGNRPGAPDGADRALQPGDKIVVLDQTRLDYLAEQRKLLSQVMPTASTDSQVSQQDKEITDLADSIYGEVDYATLGQAVPNFESVAKNIRARAPNDWIYQRAINEAKTDIQAAWKAQGRTPDQIGKLLQAGEAGDFTKVHDLAKSQFIAVADALGPNATPEAITAAIMTRAGVYTTYTTGDQRYVDAIKQAAGDASHEILVERPINSVLDIAKAGGKDWQEKSIAKLRQITDPATHTPEQVLGIMSDPRIQHLVRQSVRHTDSLDSPDQGQIWSGWEQTDTIFKDLSAIYDTTFYADGKTPGKGKQLVDDMAGFFVDATSQLPDGTSQSGFTTAQNLGHTIDESFFESGSGEGHIALALAIAAKAKGTDNKAFTGVNSPLYAVKQGIKNYAKHIDDLLAKAKEDGGFIANPVANVDKYLSPTERLALIDKMYAASDPKKVTKLADDLNNWQSALEQREPMQLAMKAYSPALNGDGRFNEADSALSKIPVPDPLPPAAGIADTNGYWFTRTVRAFATAMIKSGTQMVFGKDSPAMKALFTGEKLSIREGRWLDRASRGWSTYLFMANARALYDKPMLIDRIYAPVHSAMAVSEASKAFFPNAARELFTPLKSLSQRLEALHVSGITKSFLRNAAVGLLRDPLDVAYVIVDGVNSFSYFTGKNEEHQKDMVLGFTYGLSVIGDGFAITGAAATALDVELAGLSAGWWTGIGAAIGVVAAGGTYFKGLHDHAHEFDDQNAKAWELLGIKDTEVAKALGKGKTFGDDDSYKNAGPFLVEAFHRAGYSTQEMIDYINTHWSAHQADQIATEIKNDADRGDPNASFPDSDFAEVEQYAQLWNIPFPIA